MTPIANHECALTRAAAIQALAAAKGFDWPGPGGALEKVREETNEVAALIRGIPGEAGEAGEAGDDPRAGDDAKAGIGKVTGAEGSVGEEVGDLLFAVVNVARLLGLDPAAALARATAKFGRRFAEVERLARLRDLPMPGTALAPLDRIWDEVKVRERSGGDQ